MLFKKKWKSTEALEIKVFLTARDSSCCDNALYILYWITFRDYNIEAEPDLSHPAALEYFCDEHIYSARSLVGMSSAQALQVIKIWPQQVVNSMSGIDYKNEKEKQILFFMPKYFTPHRQRRF